MIPETTSGILNGNDSLTTCNDLMILMLPGTWGSRRDKGWPLDLPEHRISFGRSRGKRECVMPQPHPQWQRSSSRNSPRIDQCDESTMLWYEFLWILMISHGLMMFDLCLRAMMCNVTCNQVQTSSASKLRVQLILIHHTGPEMTRTKRIQKEFGPQFGRQFDRGSLQHANLSNAHCSSSNQSRRAWEMTRNAPPAAQWQSWMGRQSAPVRPHVAYINRGSHILMLFIFLDSLSHDVSCWLFEQREHSLTVLYSFYILHRLVQFLHILTC